MLLNVLLHAVFGCLGGLLYILVEILWRGYSHWTMVLLGGVCFVLCGILDEVQHKPHIILQMLQGAIIITALEFITGCIVNLWFGWQVWDYGDLPFNILGQVCLYFFFTWFFLAYLVIKTENLLHKLVDNIKKSLSLTRKRY